MKSKFPLLPLLILMALVFLSSLKTRELNYEVGPCEGVRGILTPRVSYDEESHVVIAEVQTNCCGTELEVRKSDSEIVIQEIQYGNLCRCVCRRKVTIRDVGKNFSVIFVTLEGKRRVLLPKTGFCGFSTYGYCRSDTDCIVSGCSGQVCSSKNESIFTTCEWKECYDSRRFGLECRCVSNACQWVKRS